MIDNLLLAELKEDINHALAECNPIDAVIAKMYYGLEGHERHSTWKISSRLYMTSFEIDLALTERINPLLRDRLKNYKGVVV